MAQDNTLSNVVQKSQRLTILLDYVHLSSYNNQGPCSIHRETDTRGIAQVDLETSCNDAVTSLGLTTRQWKMQGTESPSTPYREGHPATLETCSL